MSHGFWLEPAPESRHHFSLMDPGRRFFIVGSLAELAIALVGVVLCVLLVPEVDGEEDSRSTERCDGLLQDRDDVRFP